MRFRYKKTVILLSLSVLFALLSIPFSGALNQVKLERDVAVWVADDRNAVLELNGLDGLSYNLNKNYRNVGTITNNSNQEINLTIKVTPDFASNTKKNEWLGIEIENTAIVFTDNTDKSETVTVTLEPRQSANVRAAIKNSQKKTIDVAFDITAENASGDYIHLNDTLRSPRHIYCY